MNKKKTTKMSQETPPPASQEAPTASKTPSEIIFESIFDKPWKEVEEILKKQVPLLIEENIKSSKMGNRNVLLFLDQNNSISEEHADKIYSSLCKFTDKTKELLLILGSKGGEIEPAYMISKACKAKSSKFIVAIPRRAKSAATLISLGAHEIHMGTMSEIGPIDPQFGGIPALSLTNALQTLAKLVGETPQSADMFSKFLEKKLDLRILGYFERINDSAIQYASRLLQGKQLGKNQTPESLANHLVNHYKDHGFVIDKDEATQLLGEAMIKSDTPEYTFSNKLDEILRLISQIAKLVHKQEITYIGHAQDCIKITPIQTPKT